MPPPTGADKTTLVLFMREDHPGALLEILTEFAVRGINLTRIESRPTKKALGDFFWYLTFLAARSANLSTVSRYIATSKEQKHRRPVRRPDTHGKTMLALPDEEKLS